MKVGFLGAGNVLPAYLQALDGLVGRGRAEAGPVVARSEGARARLARLRPTLPAVAGVDQLLADEDVELVVVLTPPATHAELVGRVLAAGRHVVCEKPLAHDVETAQGLFRAAGEAGLLLLAAPFVHLSRSLRRLWAVVADGDIGEVHAARAHYGNPGSSWARWYHQEPLATLGDVGIYNLKSLAALLGPVREVTAVSATARPMRDGGEGTYAVTDPDTWQLVLRHEQGALSSILASHVTVAYRRPAIELYGTAGTANMTGDDWDPHGARGLARGRRSLGAARTGRCHVALERRSQRGRRVTPHGAAAARQPRARPPPDRGDRRCRRQRERGRTDARAEPLRAVDGAPSRVRWT